MCFGPEIAAFASAAAPYATAASIGLNLASVAQKRAADEKVRRERDNVMRQQAERQRLQQQQMDARLQQTVQETSPEQYQQNLDARAAEIEAATAPEALTPPASGEYSAGPASAPKEVKDDLARRLYGVLADAKGYAKRAAKVGAYGEANFDQATALSRSSQDLGTIQSNINGNMNALPYELDWAQAKGANSRGWSDVLGGAGDLAMIGGIYGNKPKGPRNNNEGVDWTHY